MQFLFCHLISTNAVISTPATSFPTPQLQYIFEEK